MKGSPDYADSGDSLAEAVHFLVRELGRIREVLSHSNNNAILQRLAEMETKIMASNAEVTKQLSGAIERLTKIGNETRKLLTLIEELKAGGGINAEASPEVKAKADELDVQLGVVDELVPDEVTPPPVE